MEHILALLIEYKYFILFPLAAIEGPIVSLAAGFLIHTGHLSFIPTYLIFILGDVIPDCLYYYLGKFGDKKQILQKYISKDGFVSRNLNLIEKLWMKHSFKTMFLSKFAYGLSTPLLICAGLIKAPFRKFIEYSFILSVFQYGAILLTGYLLGSSYFLALKYIKYTEIIIAIIIIVLVFAYIYFSKYARKQILEVEKEK